eukprot:SAG31_NODE_564_length_14059_cov_5.728940_10_plen_86_part_00
MGTDCASTVMAATESIFNKGCNGIEQYCAQSQLKVNERALSLRALSLGISISLALSAAVLPRAASSVPNVPQSAPSRHGSVPAAD